MSESSCYSSCFHSAHSGCSHTAQVLFCRFAHSTGIVLSVHFAAAQHWYCLLSVMPSCSISSLLLWSKFIFFSYMFAAIAYLCVLYSRHSRYCSHSGTFCASRPSFTLQQVVSAIPFYVCRSLSLSLSLLFFFFLNLKPCFLNVFSDPHFAFLCRLYSLKFASLRLFGNSPCNLSPDKVLQGGAKG